MAAELKQVLADLGFQFFRLGKLGVQFGAEARHLFIGTDVAARRDDVAVRVDFGGGGGFAEAGDVGEMGSTRALACCLRRPRGRL